MDDKIMDQEEVMKLVSDVLDSANDTKSARAGLVNLINNPAYNISSHLKSVFLHVASSDEALEEFRTEIKANALEDEVKEPVIIPETYQNVFFDKLMSRRIRRARLLDDRIIIPYDNNNKQLIHALMDSSFDNKFGFILSNSNNKGNVNANFILGSSNKSIDSEQFYQGMNVIVDAVDTNRDYMQGANVKAELVKIVQLFDNAINNNISFNIGLTPRENGNKEIIISSEDSSFVEALRGSGITGSDSKFRISDDFLGNLNKVDMAFIKRTSGHVSSDINASSAVNYSLYDSKKVDGTDVQTELYEEVTGNNVYMSTNISNVEAQVAVNRDYMFTSKTNFGVVKNNFFHDNELVARSSGVIRNKSSDALSCVFELKDGKINSWGSDATVDNYGEVTMLYSQLETLPTLKETEAAQNEQSASRGGQVLVKSNPNLPPTLPSQENTSGINNSGFSNTFLFVTLVALELMAIAFGIFMLVK